MKYTKKITIEDKTLFDGISITELSKSDGRSISLFHRVKSCKNHPTHKTYLSIVEAIEKLKKSSSN